MNFRTLSFIAAAIVFSLPLFCKESSQKMTALSIREQALKQDSVQESISFVQNHLEEAQTLADKRSALCFLGELQEQLGVYSEASLSYVKAAGIAAGDAAGVPKVSTEQLVLNAVRCCLNSGDAENAESYLNSAVRSSKNEEVQAYVKLYSVWTSLCKASSFEDTLDSIQLLKAYSAMDSMELVKPSVLYTLWYLSGEDEYAITLKKKYPASVECALLKGEAVVASVPFWYFVPRKGYKEVAGVEQKAMVSENTETKTKKDEGKICYQTGFFASEENAKKLISRLKKAGFTAYIYDEVRPSGKKYYGVVVDENQDGNMSKKLKEAGFDNYPVKIE